MDKFSTQEGSLKCKNIMKCGKKGKLKYGIMASTFKLRTRFSVSVKGILSSFIWRVLLIF